MITVHTKKNSSRNFKIAMSQPSLSICFSEVTNAIIAEYINKVFIFSKTNVQRQAASNSFLSHIKFPGVLGCIDCTRVYNIMTLAERRSILQS
jgi:hypothetical protein